MSEAVRVGPSRNFTTRRARYSIYPVRARLPGNTATGTARNVLVLERGPGRHSYGPVPEMVAGRVLIGVQRNRLGCVPNTQLGDVAGYKYSLAVGRGLEDWECDSYCACSGGGGVGGGWASAGRSGNGCRARRSGYSGRCRREWAVDSGCDRNTEGLIGGQTAVAASMDLSAGDFLSIDGARVVIA